MGVSFGPPGAVLRFASDRRLPGSQPHRFAPNRRRRFAVEWKEFGPGEYRRSRLVSASQLPVGLLGLVSVGG